MALEVDIEKSFGAFRLRVNFTAENERFALLGASGCGKSVTLRCIAGILKPDRGRIVLNGRSLFDSEKRISLPPQARHAGFLFQQYALFPNMTVRQNIAAALPETGRRRESSKSSLAAAGTKAPSVGSTKKTAEQRVTELMEKFRITDIADLRPGQISGGQKQRTALARILASDPEIILLDEPFSALDSFLKYQLEYELQNTLAEFCGPVLWVSHDRGEVYRNCDRVCVIDRGMSTETQTVKELFAAPATEAAARLSGCTNFTAAVTRAEKKELKDTEVFLPEWNLTFSCGRPVPADMKCIGIRAQHVMLLSGKEREETAENTARKGNPDGPTGAAGTAVSSGNRFVCRVVRIVEDEFSMIVLLRPEGASETAPLLRMETEKAAWAKAEGNRRSAVRTDGIVYEAAEQGTLGVKISPENILLLR